MAGKNNANLGFEKQIWDATCELWGHIPATDYRKVIVGLIFLRYISTAFEKRYAQLVAEGDGFEDDVDLFANNIGMSGTDEDKDWLGRTYEYCIALFAAYEGTIGGEFYTPSSIVKTIVEVLKPFDNCRVYDPYCGSGGMFVQSVKFIQAHSGNRNRISVYGTVDNGAFRYVQIVRPPAKRNQRKIASDWLGDVRDAL